MSSKGEELGISRSGRVRKKSSKLIDFESPEEAEQRPKKTGLAVNKTPKAKTPAKPVVVTPVPPLKIKKQQNHLTVVSYQEDEYENEFADLKAGIMEDDLHDTLVSSFRDDTMSPDIPGCVKEELVEEEVDDNFDDYMEDDIKLETMSDIEADYIAGSSSLAPMESPVPPPKTKSSVAQGQSLYLTEKSKKKTTGKATPEVKGKTQRKDKGKTRVTAYMLWAKEKRPEVARQFPDMDFPAVSKKLGEIWSTVSKAERSNWRRRALRAANKAPGGMITTGNKPRARSPAKKPASAVQVTKTAPQKRTTSMSELENYGFDSVASFGSLPSPTSIPSGNSRLGGTEPLDVAAHLHLIGESLSVIGARLKEHEGQIAVSGSLSVLLDSALCALGPMLCLTRLAPETDGCPAETLTRILDNIAYIMPGL